MTSNLNIVFISCKYFIYIKFISLYFYTNQPAVKSRKQCLSFCMLLSIFIHTDSIKRYFQFSLQNWSFHPMWPCYWDHTASSALHSARVSLHATFLHMTKQRYGSKILPVLQDQEEKRLLMTVSKGSDKEGKGLYISIQIRLLMQPRNPNPKKFKIQNVETLYDRSRDSVKCANTA